MAFPATLPRSQQSRLFADQARASATLSVFTCADVEGNALNRVGNWAALVQAARAEQENRNCSDPAGSRKEQTKQMSDFDLDVEIEAVQAAYDRVARLMAMSQYNICCICSWEVLPNEQCNCGIRGGVPGEELRTAVENRSKELAELE